MSGILALVRELVAIYHGGRIQSASLFWRCVWVAFIVSAAWLWFIEHRHVVLLQQELAKSQEANRPEFRIEVDKLFSAPMAGQSGVRWGTDFKTFVLVEAAITNAGSPSIAKSWSLSVELPTGEREMGTRLILPSESISFGEVSGKKFEYYGADALEEKTYQTPIAHGAEIPGVLAFGFLSIPSSSIHKDGTKAILRCEDYLGREYSGLWTPGEPSSPFAHHPGLKRRVGQP